MAGYQCFHCLKNAVSWDSDFNPEDMGYDDEEGVIHILHCSNCGTEIEYRVFNRKEEEDATT